MHIEATSGPYEFSTAAVNPLGQWKNYTQGCELLDSYGVPSHNAMVTRGAVTNSAIEFAYAERLIASPTTPAHVIRASTPSAKEVMTPTGLASVGFNSSVPAGARFTLYKVTAFADTRLVPQEQLEEFVLAQVAGVTDLPALRKDHEAAWDELWSRCPEFDHPLNEMTPAMLYILLTSMGSGLPVDMQVCGLSNTRPWTGKSFEWDQSIFVLPGLMALYPEETRDLLEGHLRRYAVRRDLGGDAKSGGSGPGVCDSPVSRHHRRREVVQGASATAPGFDGQYRRTGGVESNVEAIRDSWDASSGRARAVARR